MDPHYLWAAGHFLLLSSTGTFHLHLHRPGWHVVPLTNIRSLLSSLRSHCLYVARIVWAYTIGLFSKAPLTNFWYKGEWCELVQDVGRKRDMGGEQGQQTVEHA